MLFFRLLKISIALGVLFLSSCSKEAPDCRLDIIGVYEGVQDCDQLLGNRVHVARASFEDQLVLSFQVLTWPGVLVALNAQCDTATMEVTTLEEGLRANGEFVFTNARMTGYLAFLDGDTCKYDMVLTQ